MQAAIDSNRQDYDEKMKKKGSKIDKLASMVKNIMDRIQIYNSSPEKIDSPKSQGPYNLLLDKNNYPPLEVGNS